MRPSKKTSKKNRMAGDNDFRVSLPLSGHLGFSTRRRSYEIKRESKDHAGVRNVMRPPPLAFGQTQGRETVKPSAVLTTTLGKLSPILPQASRTIRASGAVRKVPVAGEAGETTESVAPVSWPPGQTLMARTETSHSNKRSWLSQARTRGGTFTMRLRKYRSESLFLDSTNERALMPPVRIAPEYPSSPARSREIAIALEHRIERINKMPLGDRLLRVEWSAHRRHLISGITRNNR